MPVQKVQSDRNLDPSFKVDAGKAIVEDLPKMRSPLCLICGESEPELLVSPAG